MSGLRIGRRIPLANGRITLIAARPSADLTTFGDTVVLNSAGVVGFSAKVSTGNDSIIGIGDGGPIKVIASAGEQGLVGGGFLGIAGINDPYRDISKPYVIFGIMANERSARTRGCF